MGVVVGVDVQRSTQLMPLAVVETSQVAVQRDSQPKPQAEMVRRMKTRREAAWSETGPAEAVV